MTGRRGNQGGPMLRVVTSWQTVYALLRVVTMLDVSLLA